MQQEQAILGPLYFLRIPMRTQALPYLSWWQPFCLLSVRDYLEKPGNRQSLFEGKAFYHTDKHLEGKWGMWQFSRKLEAGRGRGRHMRVRWDT